MRANNWVTGTNPAVHSFYERILAANPKIRGHAQNVAETAQRRPFTLQASFLTRIHVDLIVEALGWNSNLVLLSSFIVLLSPSLNVADETLAINWPIPLERAELSAKDRAEGSLADVTPIPPRKTLVVGASGQLGRALRAAYADVPHVEFAGRTDVDLTSRDLGSARPWRDYDTIINAGAYTAVDLAETAEGRAAAWAANVTGVAALAKVATTHGLRLVHISSDYVFDGTATSPYREDDPLTPLGVYGQTKAAGDQIVATVPRHYVVRTSWVIGDGRNFVRTMLSLADKGVDPSVVDDQVGRLTFTSELARAIRHLTEARAPYGTYNVTGSGSATSWADVAHLRSCRARSDRVGGVSTAEYFGQATNPVAPRPLHSVLDLTKIESTGFVPDDADETLENYVRIETREASGTAVR